MLVREGDGHRLSLPLVRMGRGLMMGVDHNKGLNWVGASAALTPIDRIGGEAGGSDSRSGGPSGPPCPHRIVACLSVSASRHRRPATCTSAARGRRCSTGSTCAGTAARSSFASKTPTSNGRRPTWSRASWTACVARPRLGRRPGRRRAARAVLPDRTARSVPRAAAALVASGHAYRCYCNPDELKAKREAAQAAGSAWIVRPRRAAHSSAADRRGARGGRRTARDPLSRAGGPHVV